MKKPKNIDPPRRKRALSGEEVELWDDFTKQMKPLRKTKRAVKETVAAGAKLATPPAPSLKSSHAPLRLKPSIAAKPSAPPLAPIGRREKSHLARGKKEIDARLDLHGMTQARAHRALRNFLNHASDNGCTFVLVITGKGRTVEAGAERGLLKRMVPEWLGLPEFRSVVVGFEQAHIGHGGEGALYVRVRRAR